MNNRSVIFSIQYTNMVKGVALLLLLCNHFCVVKDWITPPNELIDLYIKGKPLLGYIGAFGKICVALWAFLSGIGAYYTYKEVVMIAYRNNLIRLVNLIIQYVLILFIVFIPIIGLLHTSFVGESYNLSAVHIVCNVFACDAEYDKAAWYMRFYIMFVVSFPVILCTKKWMRSGVAFYVFAFLFFLFLPKFARGICEGLMLGTVPLNQAIGEYCSYILIVISGYAVAEYRMFEQLQSKMSPRMNISFSILSLLAAMAIRSYTKSISIGIVDIYTDIIITPFVVYAFFVFFQHASKLTKQAFVYVGKASMVVWLVHWVFNIGVYEIQRIAYFPKVSYLVIIWVLILCLGFNIIFSYLIKKSNILITISNSK